MVCLRLGLATSNFAVRALVNNSHAHCLFNIYSLNSVRNIRTSTRKCNAQTDRLYTSKHEWIHVNGPIGTVGISHYAQEALGDVVFAQLPEIGTSIEKNSEVGALESVKAASEIYSPVSGEIVERNEEVEKTPGLINESCYEKGWLFKVKLSNTEELKQLLNEDKYQEFLKTADEPH